MARGYISLIRSHPYDVGYLLLHSFASSLGQTFFISLFVPQFRSQFDLSSARFGLMYSMATLLNALMFPLAGAYLDRWSIRKFSTFTGLLIMVSCLTLAFSKTLPILFLGLALIRLGGQSLMTHISTTTAARIFGDNRGKALGITNLGYPLGEGLLPPVLGLILSRYSHQWVFIFLGISILAAFFPLARFLYNRSETISGIDNVSSETPKQKKVYRFDLFLDFRFLLLIPGMVCGPLLLTGFIFHQSSLAEMLNWPHHLWMASWFFLFAIARVAASFVTGPLTDKLTAGKLYPYFLLPLAIGVFAFIIFDTPYACLVFLLGGGLTMGASGTIKTALLPEIFGTRTLGAIRSLCGMLMAMSTAVSPWLFGALFDKGLGKSLLWASVLYAGLSIGLSVISLKAYANNKDANLL